MGVKVSDNPSSRLALSKKLGQNPARTELKALPLERPRKADEVADRSSAEFGKQQPAMLQRAPTISRDTLWDRDGNHSSERGSGVGSEGTRAITISSPVGAA